jgi:threonine/homoserine/homoserine lactone efflux protein
MFGTQHLWLFVVSGLLLNITPGQDTLYIVTRSVAQGRAAGVWSVLGISSGSVLHTLAAAFGLSAILATSAQAFLVVKFAGAAYLVYLGVKMLLERPAAAAPAGVDAGLQHESAWAIYRAGLLTNVLNPKVALFFLAFVPQFIAPETANKPLAFLLLGTLFNINAIFVNVGWALLAGWTARRVGAVRRGMHWLERGAGALFIGFGIRLALAENPGAAPSVH